LLRRFVPCLSRARSLLNGAHTALLGKDAKPSPREGRFALLLGLASAALPVLPGCGSCGAATASLEQILSIAANAVALLSAAKEASAASANAIQTAFTDLERNARANDITPVRIKHMERTELDLKERSTRLSSRLKEAHDAASSLFSQLEAKAKANKTEEYRERMLRMYPSGEGRS